MQIIVVRLRLTVAEPLASERRAWFHRVEATLVSVDFGIDGDGLTPVCHCQQST